MLTIRFSSSNDGFYFNEPVPIEQANVSTGPESWACGMLKSLETLERKRSLSYQAVSVTFTHCRRCCRGCVGVVVIVVVMAAAAVAAIFVWSCLTEQTPRDSEEV